MSLPRFFRALILSQFGLALLQVALSISLEDNPTAETSITISAPLWFAVPALVTVTVVIIALIALWRFRNWARWAYVISLAVALTLILAVPGTSLPASAVDNFFDAGLWLISGMIIALMYFSPVALLFRDAAPDA